MPLDPVVPTAVGVVLIHDLAAIGAKLVRRLPVLGHQTTDYVFL